MQEPKKEGESIASVSYPQAWSWYCGCVGFRDQIYPGPESLPQCPWPLPCTMLPGEGVGEDSRRAQLYTGLGAPSEELHLSAAEPPTEIWPV